jgi:hypothetical protein
MTFRILPIFSAGIEFNPVAEKGSPLANLVAVPETETRPAVILGTSSDRIGTPSGQSVYVTVSKDIQNWTGLPVAPYWGVTYGTYEERWRPIGGTAIRFPHNLSSLVIFDGVKVHPTFSYSYDRHVFSLILVESQNPGVSYSISF